MSIKSEVERISGNVSDALAATAEMGANVPETASSNDLGMLIRSIPTGGGVTDYNDLENKPCYTETGAEVLPETTCDIDPESMEGYLLDVVNVSVGNTYTVNWNGTEYTCVAQAFDLDGVSAAALGDVGAMTGGDSTGEPFVVLFFDSATAAVLGVGVGLYALDGSTSVTLSIIGEVVHKLDEKYLPEPVVLYSDDEQYLYIRPFDGDTSKRMTTIELRTIWLSASKVLIYGETYNNQGALTAKGWLLAFGYVEVSNNGNKAGCLVNENGKPEYYTAEFAGQSKE